MTVIETDNVAIFSGLFDASGNKLMVRIERDPIGFVWFGQKP